MICEDSKSKKQEIEIVLLFFGAFILKKKISLDVMNFKSHSGIDKDFIMVVHFEACTDIEKLV